MSRQKYPPEDNEIVSVLIERIEKSLVGEYPWEAVVDKIEQIGAQRNDIRDQVNAYARRNLTPWQYFSIFGAMPRSSRVWGDCY
ncbi:MAG: hypothetical protein WCK53_08015 [Methanomicrobiales archaeon]